MGQRKYEKEYKVQAVKLAQEIGAGKAAQELGIPVDTVYGWQSAFQQELDTLAALYQETVGQELPRFYRPPQGKYSEDNLRQAQALGYKTIFWSLAYVDWYADDQPTPEQAFSKLLPRIHDGAIVLLHSTSSTNADILDELLTKWEAMGYRFASLEQLP